MTYDASSRKDIRRAEKEAAIVERDRINYLASAMSISQGRTWFYDLLERCHLFSDPFTGEPLREAYSKGERNIGLAIFADICQHCPDSYITMIKEANARRITNDTARRNPAVRADEPSLGERPIGEDFDGGNEGSGDDSEAGIGNGGEA